MSGSRCRVSGAGSHEKEPKLENGNSKIGPFEEPKLENGNSKIGPFEEPKLENGNSKIGAL